jgi:hypothetical protein
VDPSWPYLLLLAPIAFLGALVYGVTGFGSALVTIPLASFVVPLPFALATFALVDWFSAWRVGLERPREVAKGEWVRLASTMIIGAALGITALFYLPWRVGLVALGLFIISYAVYALSARGPLRTVSQRWAYLAGAGGGLSGALFGAGGPPYAIYLSHRALSKEAYRATLSACSIVSITLRVLGYALAGLLLKREVGVAAACAVPAAAAGLYLGTRVFHAIDRATLARLIAIVLLATGVMLIVRAALL